MPNLIFLMKILASLAIIIVSVLIGRRFPTLGGLITTMPLTTLIVMLWIYSDRPDYQVMKDYTRGVMWGFIPTLMFYIVAYFCFSKKMSMSLILAASFSIWFVGAAFHQWLLK